MTLNILKFTFHNMFSFVDILEMTCKETGQHVMNKHFFRHNFSLIAGRDPNKDVLSILESFLDIIAKGCGAEEYDFIEEKNILYIKNLKKLKNLLIANIEEMPMYINSEDVYEKTIALWRLKVGK